MKNLIEAVCAMGIVICPSSLIISLFCLFDDDKTKKEKAKYILIIIFLMLIMCFCIYYPNKASINDKLRHILDVLDQI